MRVSKSCVIALIIVFGLVVLPTSIVVGAGESFMDISDHWAKKQIEQGVAKGYVSGYPDGTFQPYKIITRAELLRMLADALKLPRSLYGEPWYMPYAAAVIDVGIHKDADFEGEYMSSLSRLELVRLAARAVGDPFLAADETDDSDLISFAVKKGIVHGVGGGDLYLIGTATRAEAVVVIERVLAVIRGEVLPVDEMAAAQLGEEL